ncbi:MAG: DUF4199 domain-containing protein [Flavobacteriales bacterium]|nr:DUF4199 domain-containing protein [Flavobacteriales bacterium]
MKHLMNWGGILGLALIGISLVLYLLDMTEAKWAQWISYAVIAALIYLGTQAKRINQDGALSYGQGLGTGTGIAFFASIMVAFYTFVFFSFIDPDTLEQLVLRAEDQMYEQGLPDDQVEIAMEMTKKFMQPGPMAAMVVLSYTFVGFLISLVTSGILRKDGDPFASVSSDSENN